MTGLSYTSYLLNFSRPLQTAKGAITRRSGIWIAYSDEQDSYFGEAAPLPGFSTETIEEVEAFLHSAPRSIDRYLKAGMDVSPDRTIGSWIETFQNLSEIWGNLRPPPSLYFACDTILFQHWLQNRGLPLQAVSLNALASSYPQAEKAWMDGFKTIKVKIGIDLDRELDLLKQIRSDFPMLKLRLDANQSMSRDKAIQFLPRLSAFDPEYLEEPCQNPDDLMDDLTGIVPLAADESVRTLKDVQRELLSIRFQTFVIKPMICGGLGDCLSMIALAHDAGRKVVLSSSLDTGLARRMYALLASQLLLDTSHGIATGSFIQGDPWDDAHLIRNGLYYPQEVFKKA